MLMGNIMAKSDALGNAGNLVRPHGKAPAVNCPACGSKALTRSSEEISPTFRRLYLACTHLPCAMTFTASLAFEHVLSPSGISAEFRPAKIKDTGKVASDFGQMTIFELMAPTIGN